MVCGSGPRFAEPVCEGYVFGKRHGPSLFKSFSMVERSFVTVWPRPVTVTWSPLCVTLVIAPPGQSPFFCKTVARSLSVTVAVQRASGAAPSSPETLGSHGCGVPPGNDDRVLPDEVE